MITNPPYAHSAPNGQPWEPLFTPFGDVDTNDPTKACSGKNAQPCPHCESMSPYHGHLNKVAWWTANFAANMFPTGPARDSARQWAYLAGLWHDLGKFSEAFQKRLRGAEIKANHSTAGAQLAEDILKPFGKLLAYPILGHHSGLGDYQHDPSSLVERLKAFPFLAEIRKSNPQLAPHLIEPFSLPAQIPCDSSPHSCAFFTKLLFSCLVDADFLATEKFCNTPQAASRPVWPADILQQMQLALTSHFDSFPKSRPGSINDARGRILANCLAAAERPIGFHTLTVPTGGGKTLSSLAFALAHARQHDLRRVIYVIPFTSIIEQNAGVFREVYEALSKAIGHPVILEHHSNFDPSSKLEEDDIPVHKLAGENWDAPLVVTTNVQFFESLAHHKTSRCRKLHNLARSVIIFDEAQAFPPDHLAACLGFLRELVDHAHSSVVLCSATQPAFGKLPADQPGDFAKSFNKIALPLENGNSEIIDDVPGLFSNFKRTNLTILPDPLSNEELVSRIAASERSLTILNTKPHAAKVFELLRSSDSEDPANLHLSAQLTPAHRRVVLAEILRREKELLPCRLISTTVVEAGVDISFPILFRCFTGLDSLAQALGRCNRHREHRGPDGSSIPGEAFFFKSADQKTPCFLKYASEATHRVLNHPEFQNNPNELLNPPPMELYFRHAYWQHGNHAGKGWDKPDYRSCFQHHTERLPFLLNFRTFSKNFKLIPDGHAPVIIEPHPDYMPGLALGSYDKIRALLETIREADAKHFPPPPDAQRTLQQFTVLIPKPVHQALVQSADIQLFIDGRFPILTHPQSHYDSSLGLSIPTSLIPRTDQLWYV